MRQSKIYIGNLNFKTTEDSINQYFSQYGLIKEIKLITDRMTGRSKGFAFITFEQEESAKKATSADGSQLDGRQIKVNIARENREHQQRDHRDSRGRHDRDRGDDAA